MNNPLPVEQAVPQKRKLRLCYISNPNLVHTRRWVSWFAQHGHTVCLLADVPLKEAWSDVQVIDLSKVFYARYIRFPIWTIWLKRFLRIWRPDVLHAHRVNSAGWLAAASGFHPYVVTPWGTDIFIQPQESRLAQGLARYTLQHADLVTSLSEAMREQAIELGARETHLKIVQFGVELDIFTPVPVGNQASYLLKEKFSIPNHAPIVLSPRAVTSLYNLDIVLESIPPVLLRYPDVVFIFIDYNTDRAYKNKLQEMIDHLSVKASIRWLPATRSREEMAELYRLSDVVISVPSTDGTPVSVLEAMACSKPIVCTDLPPLREFITHNENGLMVPVRQAEPLAEAVINILKNPIRADEFGQKARQVVAQKANAELNMRYMESLYYQLAASGKG